MKPRVERGVRNFAFERKPKGQFGPTRHTCSMGWGQDLPLGERGTSKLVFSMFHVCLEFPWIPNSRILRDVEVRECRSEFRFSAPCRQEQFSSNSAQGAPTWRRFWPLGIYRAAIGGRGVGNFAFVRKPRRNVCALVKHACSVKPGPYALSGVHALCLVEACSRRGW